MQEFAKNLHSIRTVFEGLPPYLLHLGIVCWDPFTFYSRQMPTTKLRIIVILRLLVTFYHFPVTFYHFPPSFKNHGPAAIEFRDAVQIQTVAGKYNVTKSK